jgi:hypothetical protein
MAFRDGLLLVADLDEGVSTRVLTLPAGDTFPFQTPGAI